MTLRSYLYAAVACFAVFVLASWAIKGFPTKREPVIVVREGPSPVQIRAQKYEEERLALRARAAAESVADSALNEIRNATLRAATAYSAAPCDEDYKAQLIKALTDYVRAYIAKRDCFFFPMFCSQDNIEVSGAAFSTPLDRQVQNALREAFSRGGISSSDFPYGTQLAVRLVINGQETSAPPACRIPNGKRRA